MKECGGYVLEIDKEKFFGNLEPIHLRSFLDQPECTGLPLDEDADSFVSDVSGENNCDGCDAELNPGAAEICHNGIDDALR